MKSDLVNFYIGNHIDHDLGAHIADFVNLARYELFELGVQMIVSNQIFSDRPNLILENFSDSQLVELLNKNFNERDERLILIATEVLRDGVLDSASTRQADKEGEHYNANSEYWGLRTNGFHDVQKLFGSVICPAESLINGLSALVPQVNLYYWPLRYINSYPRPETHIRESTQLMKIYDLAFTGTLTSYRLEVINALSECGLKVIQSPASTPDYLRFALASQSRFSFAPKHYPETTLLSKMRLHWALNNDYPILVERCAQSTDLDPFVLFYDTVSGIKELLDDFQTLECCRTLSKEYQGWSRSQDSIFAPILKRSSRVQ